MSANSGAGPKTGAKTIASTATQLAAVASDRDSRRASRGVAVKALSANVNAVYIGKSDVTTATGYPLSPGESISIPVDDPARIYGIVASGTEEVRFLYL